MRDRRSADVELVIQAISDHLSREVSAAYVYGSHLRRSRVAADLDVLLIADQNSHGAVVLTIGALQMCVRRLIHPTIVTPYELRSNPMLRALAESGAQIWPITVSDMSVAVQFYDELMPVLGFHLGKWSSSRIERHDTRQPVITRSTSRIWKE
jgi:hypothetical protein